jgi:hypothetical protein
MFLAIIHPGPESRPLNGSNMARGGPGLTMACALVCFLAPPAFGADRPEVVIRPGPQPVVPLTAQEKKRVQEAIDRGVAYLKRTQLRTGSWIIGMEDGLEDPRGRNLALHYAAGFAALGGLALLESGVPAKDPAVQSAARFVRLSAPSIFRTYDVAVAVLFLDRLGDVRDRPILRSLALRLAAGQNRFGGWGYNCRVLNKAEEKKLEQALRKKTRADLPKKLAPPNNIPNRSELEWPDRTDNSNTQFAILALGAARRHGLPLDYPLGLLELRFRRSETAAGWNYHWWPGIQRGYGSMTCAGLLGLAVGRASAEENRAPEGRKEPARPTDSGIGWGLKVLGAYLRHPSDVRGGGRDSSLGPPGALNLYFLWSVERVGVLCGVDTIGGIDWYRWGAGLLLKTQRRDGSWLGRGSMGYAAADTSFALLFLKRSDLLPDLRKELYKRVRIVDPGPFRKGSLAKKGSKGSKGSSPPDWERLLASSTAEDGPLTVDLGKIKSGKPVQKTLRVRGPVAFRITGIRGDARLKAKTDSRPAKVHDLALTLDLDQAGPFQCTLYLQTDLPGRSEVAIRVSVTALPPTRR